MTPETPLDIQWLAYALADNNILSDEESQQLWESLNFTQDLAEFAEAVIDRACVGLALEEQNAVVEQFQQLVDYACEQAATGYAPEMPAASEEEYVYEAADFGDLPGFSDVATLSDELGSAGGMTGRAAAFSDASPVCGCPVCLCKEDPGSCRGGGPVPGICSNGSRVQPGPADARGCAAIKKSISGAAV